MRTNIDIDDELMEEALALSELTTKKDLIHLALREFVNRRKRRDLRELPGTVELWDDYDHKSLRV